MTISQYVLQQVHSLFQSEFSVVLPVSISSNPLVSLRSSRSYLRLLPRLPVTSIFPLITCFRRQFLCKIWPIQLALLIFVVCRMFLFSLTRGNTASLFTWLVQLIFSSTTFQNFSGISDLLSKVSMFLHYTKLRSKYSTFIENYKNLPNSLFSTTGLFCIFFCLQHKLT
jgi:hypothetical protein